ncbi:MAG: hypothetical protein BWY27_01371 [Bacteroidetes bacterium ADurb.Bin234]|nr:MAG: hypothetical protein BWY27_01371 [Bacteroidetes bacterium ADurb.Bin234]
MVKSLLETKIIDPEKGESFNKFKAKVGTVHAIIIGILFIGMYSRNSESLFEKLNFPIFISATLILILAIGSAFLIAFVYLKVPSKGKLQFYEDFLILKIKNEISTIKIAELSKLNFYIDGGKYFIGIIKNKNESILEIDIIFQSEKQIINEIVENWSEKGFQVKIINNQELSRKARLKKKTSNEDLRCDFSKYKVKIQPGLPFKAKAVIPYDKISKKVLFILSIESIESLNWAITCYYSDDIRGSTDSAFQSFGNSYLILFKDELMVMTCEDNGRGLFPIGAKKNIRDFLSKMSELSNELDFEFLKERYDKMFNEKASS